MTLSLFHLHSFWRFVLAALFFLPAGSQSQDTGVLHRQALEVAEFAWREERLAFIQQKIK